MAEFVRVDARSLTEIEVFLAEATGVRVHLGRVVLAPGHVGALVASIARASAITFGPVICLDRRHGGALRADPRRAHLDVLGSLLVHELVHTWQYRIHGCVVFLATYLFSYFTKIYTLKSIRSTARRTAYSTIPFEVEAFALEAKWRSVRR